jgi:hypothetical protein
MRGKSKLPWADISPPPLFRACQESRIAGLNVYSELIIWNKYKDDYSYEFLEEPEDEEEPET